MTGPSRPSALALVLSALLASSAMAAVSSVKPELNSGLSLPTTLSNQGCYASSQSMTWAGNYQYMDQSICQILCVNLNLPVVGTSAAVDCYCGQTMPPTAAKTDDSSCNVGCAGYGKIMCGGANSTNSGVILSIWNDGLSSSISNDGDALAVSSSSTSKPAATATTPSVVTITNAGGSVTTVMVSATPSSGGLPSSGASKAGIAAGVVVGVIAIAAIAGGVWFFLRQKKRKAVEEEHKRQVAVSSFIARGKSDSSSHSQPDVRLDPAILRDRRMSDGSIMDNQDYSRRILKVTNA